MVTHDHEEAFTVADRLAVMRAGEIVQQGAIDEVWRAPVDPETALFLGYARVLEGAAAAIVRDVRPVETGSTGRTSRTIPPLRLAVRRSAFRVDPDGELRGTVTAARVTPEQVRLVVDVDGVGEVDAVAPLDQHPGIGESVRLVGRRHPHRAGGRLNAVAPAPGPLPTLTCVYRRAWVLMVVLAVGMAAWAIIEAVVLDKKLVDPEGSFLGPSYIRLPILLLGALLLDLLPLTSVNSWRRRGRSRPSSGSGCARTGTGSGSPSSRWGSSASTSST